MCGKASGAEQSQPVDELQQEQSAAGAACSAAWQDGRDDQHRGINIEEMERCPTVMSKSTDTQRDGLPVCSC